MANNDAEIKKLSERMESIERKLDAIISFWKIPIPEKPKKQVSRISHQKNLK